ncbi:MAG: class I SAM-dependent rRNA methyltransferase [Methanoregulaceae archaeon]|nr:class I SAM-dependent rRNA methyltransferase [Methanoregulaceae archaeon]
MADPRPAVHLARGREKKIRNGYPWVQREEVFDAVPSLPGQIARLFDCHGDFLALGLFNPNSRFPFRVLSLQDEPIDADFFRRRLDEAARRRVGVRETDSLREFFAEADGIPGLIVDRFDRTLVVQVRNAGMERLREVWEPVLLERFDPVAMYDKSDMEGRREEGLEPHAELRYGTLPEPVLVQESGFVFEAPVVEGLKTGFYLDQRGTRRRLAERIKPGERLLDAFCYTGTFSHYAARAGAEVTAVDISPVAIEAARRNAERNGVHAEFIEANVFDWLEESGPTYDWIVLDPPAIAKGKGERNSLKWAVWKLVFNGLPRLVPGGRMVVCSCSYQLGLGELIETVRLAAADRGRRAFLEEITLQDLDHPTAMAFPESGYLKCAWVRME